MSVVRQGVSVQYKLRARLIIAGFFNSDLETSCEVPYIAWPARTIPPPFYNPWTLNPILALFILPNKGVPLTDIVSHSAHSLLIPSPAPGYLLTSPVTAGGHIRPDMRITMPRRTWLPGEVIPIVR